MDIQDDNLTELLSGTDGRWRLCSALLTENELIQYLRIPEVSRAKDHHNAVENLKRMHNLPRIHICGQPLYPREVIQEWIHDNTTTGK